MLLVAACAVFGGCTRSPPPAEPVAATGTGTATLSWDPPPGADGHSTAAVAGYHVYYGTSPSQLKPAGDLKGADSTSYVITGLGPGTYYFAVRSYNSAGEESAASNLGSKTF